METIKNLSARVGMGATALVTILGVSVLLAGPSSAQTADPVLDAFDDMQAKILLYGAAIVALVVLAVGIFLGIKYLKKGVHSA